MNSVRSSYPPDICHHLGPTQWRIFTYHSDQKRKMWHLKSDTMRYN